MAKSRNNREEFRGGSGQHIRNELVANLQSARDGVKEYAQLLQNGDLIEKDKLKFLREKEKLQKSMIELSARITEFDEND
jgi:hypothetical protein